MLLENKNIIWCHKSDSALFWVHNLCETKIKIYQDDRIEIHYSKIFDLYFFYLQIEDTVSDDIISNIKQLSNNNLHVVLSDFRCIGKVIQTLDNETDIKYSILNHFGEMIYDHYPLNVKDLKKIRFYFSCSDLFNTQNEISQTQYSTKFIRDFRYSLTYFYFKLGYNFLERNTIIPHNYVHSKKVFLYTKSKSNTIREDLIKMALNTTKIYEKNFDENDKFWFEINNKTHHTSSLVDYSKCLFNLIIETQPITKEKNILSNFCTEKTLKSLILSTPSYVLMQEDVYNDLIKFGFYFLNQEFGDYNFQNYIRFCDFISKSKQSDLEDLYKKVVTKSQFNKIKLEEYIYSDKTKEIKLLTNTD